MREIVQGYASNAIPLDAIWNDIDWMDEYEDFTTGQGFEDLGGFVNEIHAKNLHYVPILDAGIAKRDGYAAYEDGMKRGVFI